MAQDPWDWTNSSKPMGAIAAPLAAIPMPQGNASTPSSMNTTGPLQQMVQSQLMNQGFKKAFEPNTKLGMDKVSDVLATTPDPSREVTRSMSSNPSVEVGGPMSGDGATMTSAPLESMAPIEPTSAVAPLEAVGTEAALTTGAKLGATEVATAAAEPTLLEMATQAAMMFAADGTTSVPNKGKGGK